VFNQHKPLKERKKNKKANAPGFSSVAGVQQKFSIALVT